MNLLINLLQCTGGIIIAIGSIPQIRHTLKTKSVKDFNVKYFLMLVIGLCLMEIYAVYKIELATMFFITNTLSLLMAIVLLGLYFKYK